MYHLRVLSDSLYIDLPHIHLIIAQLIKGGRDFLRVTKRGSVPYVPSSYVFQHAVIPLLVAIVGELKHSDLRKTM